MDIILPNKWKPRPYQMDAWRYLHNGGKRAVLRWHRRTGKDDLCLNYMACAAHERIGTYWYCLPEYSQARKAVFDAVNPHTGIKRLDQAIPKEIRSATNQNEMKITLKCGSSFQLVGSDNPDSLVGSPPVGLVLSEYALSNPSAWAYLMPIFEENNGWVIFNSTTRGKNHFYKTCILAEKDSEWLYDVKTVDNTNVFTELKLQRIRDELYSLYGEQLGEAFFQQEYYVSFEAATPGSVWGDSIAKIEAMGQVCEVEHDPAYPVHTSYDIGKHDATAIWFFQVIGQQINVINYFESNHHDIDYYCEHLRTLSNTLGYRYGNQYLPHDAFQDRMGQGGKTIIQQFIDFGKDGKLGKFKRVPSTSKEGGIQAARATFPRCWFDAVNCAEGLEALKSYHHVWDDEKKMFTKEPFHDWSSNGSDSFRYLSLVWKEARENSAAIPIDVQLINNSVQSLPMKKIVLNHFNKQKQMRNEYL